MNLEITSAGFVTTCWTVVESLNSSDEAVRLRCKDELIRRYWPPVYGWLRRHGQGRELAAETTEAFFADVVLQRELFEGAARSRGRLRSLVMSALKNYRVDTARRAAARGAGLRVPLDGRDADIAADSPGDSPEAAFDREWAAAVLDEAMRRAELHFIRTGKARHWRVFEARVLRPATGGAEPRPLGELAAEQDFRTPADAAAAVQVVKKRVQALIEEVVAETVGNADELADELRDIRSVLA